MRKPETTFRLSVEKYLPTSLYRMKNSNPYTTGVADSWYSGTKTDLWVEWKFQILPKRPSTLILAKPSPLQCVWLQARCHEGRNVAVILGCPDGGVVYQALSWAQALTCEQFRMRIKTRRQLAAWIEGEVCGLQGSRC